MLHDYYETKRRMAAGDLRVEKRGQSYSDHFDTLWTEVLGYEVPGPVLDDDGKPLKVWSTDVRMHLPEGWTDAYPLRQTPGSHRRWHYGGYIVAKTRIEVGRLLHPDDERMAKKTAAKDGQGYTVGEVAHTDLAYLPAVEAHRNGSIIVKVDEALVHVPRADLKGW